MKRIHLFEFEDQPWFPKLFRRFITDLIQYQQTTFDVYTPVVPKIMEIMQKLNCRQIIDLCSGSGGPLLRIQEILSDSKEFSSIYYINRQVPQCEYPSETLPLI